LNQILVKANDDVVKTYSAQLENISADGKYKETIPQKEIPAGNFTLKILAVDKAEHSSEVSRNVTSVPAPDFVMGKVYSFVSESYTPFAMTAASLQEGENSLLLLTSSGVMKLTHDEALTLKQQKLTSSGAYAAKTAKINPSDSYMDLITAQSSGTGSSKIVIYLQTASKTFTEALSKEVAAVVKDFVVTDVNGDTYKDIVAITDKEDKTLAVILGSQSGLTNPVYYGGVSNAYSIAAGVFHQEEIIDVVVGRSNSDSVSIFKGNGDGEFKLASNMYVGANARKIMSGEFDAPGGFSDLAALAEGDSRLIVLKGKGNGAFAVMDTLLTGENPSDFAADDFDGDGFVDFAIMSGLTSLIAPFFGDAESKFNKQNWINAGGVGASSVASLDLNGDGHKDFAVLNVSNKAITIIYGEENRKFHGAQEIRVHPEGGESGALEPFSMAAGRFTGKQTNDLAVLVRGYVPSIGSSPKSAIILYASDGSLPDGYNEMNKVSMFSLQQPTSIQAADINNDQKLDLVVGSDDAPEYNEDNPAETKPSIEIMLNTDNNGAFTIGKSFYAGKQPSLVALAD
ncbi:MAG: hypothetical protein FJ088_10900, partial [Deltaproteobacteria bacterium]|nr:hypothetical protein [Deltaproteobacteria bacterium]